MKQIVITIEAKFDLLEVEDYIFTKYNLEVLMNFTESFDQAIDLLRQGNVVFERYEDTKFRKFLLTKHNSLIYEDTPTTIFIIKILQNFQDPEENYKQLSE